jgi:hypothetical protein
MAADVLPNRFSVAVENEIPVLPVAVDLVVVSSDGSRQSWPLQVLYAGAVPGLVSGVLHPDFPPGRHEVILTIGGKMSRTGVTLTVE